MATNTADETAVWRQELSSALGLLCSTLDSSKDYPIDTHLCLSLPISQMGSSKNHRSPMSLINFFQRPVRDPQMLSSTDIQSIIKLWALCIMEERESIF